MKILIIIPVCFLLQNYCKNCDEVKFRVHYEDINSDNEEPKSNLSVSFHSGFFDDIIHVFLNENLVFKDTLRTNQSTGVTGGIFELNLSQLSDSDTIRVYDKSNLEFIKFPIIKDYKYLNIYNGQGGWSLNYQNRLNWIE